MFKFNTVKLLAVSMLSVSAAQAVAEDFYSGEGSVPAPASENAEQQNSNWVDFSDPTAIYSKVGLGTGTEGVDVYASLGGYLGGQFEQKLTIELMHDMDYYNIDYLAFNSTNDTGFSVKTRWNSDDDDENETSIGVIKKLRFEQNQDLYVYPAMRLGHIWDWDDSVESTTFVQIEATVRYSINPNFWAGVTPTYKYALNGQDIKDLDATVDAGYQLAEEVAVAIHANNDDEVWADFTFAF